MFQSHLRSRGYWGQISVEFVVSDGEDRVKINPNTYSNLEAEQYRDGRLFLTDLKKPNTPQASDNHINITMRRWLHFYDNELIVLVGGDRDYVPTLEEIKFSGKNIQVYVIFPEFRTGQPMRDFIRYHADGSTIWEHLLRSAAENNLGNDGGGDGGGRDDQDGDGGGNDGSGNGGSGGGSGGRSSGSVTLEKTRLFQMALAAVPKPPYKSSKSQSIGKVSVTNFVPTDSWALEDENPPTIVRQQPEKAVVPLGFDAGLVRPVINRLLESHGYSAHPSIYTTGILTDVHDDILQALSTTGISLYHEPYSCNDMVDLILDHAYETPPPVCPPVYIPPNFYPLINDLQEKGYNLIFPFPLDSPQEASSTRVKCLWKEFLLADPRPLEEDRCSETGESGEPALWVFAVCCRICGPCLAGRVVDNFITHISTGEHELKLPNWFTPSGYVCLDKDEEAIEGGVEAPFATTVLPLA